MSISIIPVIISWCLLSGSSYGLSSNTVTYMGTEESLRDDILKLFDGKLLFNDNNIPNHEEELNDITPANESEYDFIVIGAGSAGATMASRLTEIRYNTVLLIEAGSKEYPIMDIPYVTRALQFSDEINWKYQTEPSDKYCLGFTESRCNWPRGKVMGGSSVLNFMIASRGNKKDYNDWAIETGDPSWSYSEMLKYFKKLENFNVTGIEVNEDYHNTSGPMYITSAPDGIMLTETFIKAGIEAYYPVNDYNGPEQIGFSYLQSTKINGERWSVNRGYLHSARRRKNLFLTRNSRVNKILIKKSTKLAYGVQFTKYHRNIEVRARKEIILCAGAINSPQILMLSGIGPANHLRDLGINVIKDSPVGENLMDHLTYSGLVYKVNDTKTTKDLDVLDCRNSAVKDYVNKRTGPLAVGTGFGGISFHNVYSEDTRHKNPNIEFLFGYFPGIKDPWLSSAFGVREDYVTQMNADYFNHSSWTVWPMLLKPKSRGKMELQSKDPSVKPKFYPNYLDHPDDMKLMIEGIREVILLSKLKHFQAIGSELYDIPLPCKNHILYSDSYWECALRTYTTTFYHQCCTCKMGREDDPTAVVNTKSQVIGIKRLRVVDASIFPDVPTAHLNIPVIATAEKIADVIKRHWF